MIVSRSVAKLSRQSLNVIVAVAGYHQSPRVGQNVGSFCCVLDRANVGPDTCDTVGITHQSLLSPTQLRSGTKRIRSRLPIKIQVAVGDEHGLKALFTC